MPLRQYDPTIARWTSIDPVTHFSNSTYNAFDNNPIVIADPSGADGIDINKIFENTANDGLIHHYNSSGEETGTTDPKKQKKKNQKKDVKDMGTGELYGMAYNGESRTAFLNGNDPYNPTEADIAQNERQSAEAAGQIVLFISGEWATVKVLQGGAWVIRIVRARNIAKGVNVAQGAVKFSDEAAAAFKRLGNLTAFARIKNGVANINIGFLKNFKPGDIKLVEEAFKANGASSMRVSSGISVDKVIVNALNKRIQSGQGFMGYNIQSGWRAWVTGNRYILTKPLK